MTELILEKDLKHIKLKIKTWESEFSKTNKRKPLQEDIQQASSEIKEAYKKYWILKKKIEAEKINKEDVWSEKFNKSANKNTKIEVSNKIFEKFCNKIRERSSETNDINISKSPQKQAVISKLYTPTQLDSDICNKSFCDATTDCDNIDLNNLETEMKIIKPTKKIMKINNLCKKVKSVNVLSPSVNIKSLEKKLSFETSVDNKWLERCYSDNANDFHDDNASVNKIPVSHKKKLSILDSVNSDSNMEQEDNFEHPSNNNLENLDLGSFHPISISRHSDSNSVNISPNEEVSMIDETSAHSFTDRNEKSSVNFSDDNSVIKHSTVQSLVTSESTIEEDKKNKKRKLTRTPSTDPKLTSHLERKIASGRLNENFVRVNIKKKKFSRGHKSVNIRKLKWKKWKDLKKFSGSNNNNVSSPSSCFKCGQVGHWARNCNVLTKSEQQPDPDLDDFDDAPLLTLEEVATLAEKSKIKLLNVETPKISKSADIPMDGITESSTEKSEDFDVRDTDSTIIKSIYAPTADGKVIEVPAEVFDSLKELGYSDFRNGQEIAIMRILSGLSTLVVLPTGSGKTLCYQLPAYIYAKHFKCITIVISPLVSLMEDQVTGLPAGLHAICLHSGMTDVQKKASLQDLSDGKAQILLVSPEAVIGGLAYGSSMLPSNMPPIAFACIDEVHCLSQWSHNFRPSYLQLYKVLTERFNVKCILGLTATANKSTVREIIAHLGLKNIEESVIGSTGIPENLHLSVSRDKDKDKALIQLLVGDRFSKCTSIIIYCIRRDETERLAALIRTCLQDQISDELPVKKTKSKSKKRNFLWTAEAYHAGLTHARRRSIQKQFMNGKLRVIVATIAFGMGLDKRDVRAIIHYNMPKSFESYVQEIGRAGRDGLDSHCHLFLDNEGKDIQELQRFIFSNSTDRYVIRKLLKRVFIPSQCKVLITKQNQSSEDGNCESNSGLQTMCPKHEMAFSISEAVQELDLKEENILTLLCYLELHSKKWIEVLPPTYSTCTLRCYGGPKQLRALASNSPPVAAAFALDARQNKNLGNSSSYEFAVIEVASAMGWNAASVKRALKNLEWNDQKRKTGVIVEFSNLAFHLRSPCNLSGDELDEVLDFLYQKVFLSERKELSNLKSLHSIFSNYSYAHYWSCCDEAPIEFSKAIKDAINKYFDETNNSEDIGDLDLNCSIEDNADIDICDVRSQIRDIIFTNNDQNFTGRAIARIFHGIGSPCFPSEVWGRVRKFWRCLLHVNFNLLIKLANEELKKAK